MSCGLSCAEELLRKSLVIDNRRVTPSPKHKMRKNLAWIQYYYPLTTWYITLPVNSTRRLIDISKLVHAFYTLFLSPLFVKINLFSFLPTSTLPQELPFSRNDGLAWYSATDLKLPFFLCAAFTNYTYLYWGGGNFIILPPLGHYRLEPSLQSFPGDPAEL